MGSDAEKLKKLFFCSFKRHALHRFISPSRHLFIQEQWFVLVIHWELQHEELSSVVWMVSVYVDVDICLVMGMS